MTDNTGMAPAKGMTPWRGGTGIAKLYGANPFMTAQLNAIQGAVPSKVVPPAKVVPLRGHHYSWWHPLARGFILLNEPSCEGLPEQVHKSLSRKVYLGQNTDKFP